MKKALGHTALFAGGFCACALALKTMGYPLPAPASEAHAKEVALAALTSHPTAPHRFAGDSVVADAAAKLEPAVVSIHTTGKAVAIQQDPFDGFPFPGFGMPRRGQAPRTEVPKGAGSGVIISKDGYVLTNNHVVADATKVTVNVGDSGKGYDARVIGTDPMTDIAVLKIDTHGTDLTPAQLGNSDDIRVGDWAIAVGNPLDIGTTVTLGIVSAKNRDNLSAEGHRLNSVIQTDAAINPGNSGGALANIDGQVIGINEAIYSPTGSYVGIGFAIPINAAKKIAYQLIKDGKIVRPYLGVRYAALATLSPDDRANLGIASTLQQGAVVLQVMPGSPADAAGLQNYDVVLEANRRKVVAKDDLDKLIQSLKVGDTLTLLVSRGGQNQLLTVKLRERPKSFDQPVQPDQQPQPEQP